MRNFKRVFLPGFIIFSFLILLSAAGSSFAGDLFNQDIGKSAETITKIGGEVRPKLLLVCDCMHSVAKDRVFLNKMKSELAKKGYYAEVSKYHSIANNHVLAIKNCPKGYWVVYGACLCSGTWRDLNIGINKGYLRGAWKANEIKGLVFVNLSSYMIKNLTFLKRAWDDNFSPKSFTGIENPYQYLISAGFKVAESSMYNKNVIDERRIPYLADEIIKAVGGDPSKITESNVTKDPVADASGTAGLEIRSQFASENGELGNVSGGPASLGMIMQYYGLKKSTPELAKLCGTRSVHGTGFNEMVSVAKKLGFDKSRVATGCSIDWLKSMTEAGRPVMVHVNTAGFWPQGHYMVATGVKDGKVIVADPWTGRTNSYSLAQFKAMWATRQNRAIVIEKTGAAAKAPAAAKTTVSVAATAAAGSRNSEGNLSVPSRAQRASANGSMGKYYCGPTSLGMIMQFYGVDKATKTLAGLCGTGTNGTGYNEMVSVAKKFGFSGSYVATGKNVNFLKSMTDAGKPVLVHVDTQGYWPGHYMVVTGVHDGRVYLNDPWRGCARSYTIAQFNAQWASRSNRVVMIQR